MKGAQNVKRGQIILLAVLFILAGALCWLLLRPSDEPPTVIEIVPAATATPTQNDAPAPKESAQAEIPVQPSVTPALTEQPESTAAPALTPSGALGKLSVGNKSVSVMADVEESTLKNAPGWMPDSSLPGERGMCVILGHRNRGHLKLFENVQYGDEITFEYADGRKVRYAVTNVEIFEDSADWRLPVTGADTLVIATCYPFKYTGHAPGKFQVQAELIP